MKRMIIYIICLFPLASIGQSPFQDRKAARPIQTNPQNEVKGKRIHFCSLSIRSDKQALYVIDGEISDTSKVNNIDPGNLREVIVLQAREATVIYGAQGVNGAILLFTKANRMKIFCGDHDNMIL